MCSASRCPFQRSTKAAVWQGEMQNFEADQECVIFTTRKMIEVKSTLPHFTRALGNSQQEPPEKEALPHLSGWNCCTLLASWFAMAADEF